jgi:hypothetical protein
VAGSGAGAGEMRAWGWLWLFPSLVVRVVRVVVAAECRTVKSVRFLVLLALKQFILKRGTISEAWLERSFLAYRAASRLSAACDRP